MTRDQALALAAAVRAACKHEVEVEQEDGWFEVSRSVRSGSRSSTDSFTLRDEQDWVWLANRIIG